MKKAISIAIAALGIGFSSLTLADHDRYRYDQHHRHYDKHYRSHHYDKHRHWSKYSDRRYHNVRYYGPVHHHTRVIYRDDDFYEWMGGLYLLNEVLHHDRH